MASCLSLFRRKRWCFKMTKPFSYGSLETRKAFSLFTISISEKKSTVEPSFQLWKTFDLSRDWNAWFLRFFCSLSLVLLWLRNVTHTSKTLQFSKKVEKPLLYLLDFYKRLSLQIETFFPNKERSFPKLSLCYRYGSSCIVWLSITKIP